MTVGLWEDYTPAHAVHTLVVDFEVVGFESTVEGSFADSVAGTAGGIVGVEGPRGDRSLGMEEEGPEVCCIVAVEEDRVVCYIATGCYSFAYLNRGTLYRDG